MSSFKTLSFGLLTAATLTFTSTSSWAAGFADLSVGNRNHTLKLTDAGLNSESKAVMSAPVFGAKLGYRSPMGVDLNLAYDYAAGKADMSPTVEKIDFTHSTAAVQLGVNAMGLMKIYLGYGFSNDLELKQGSLYGDKKLSGIAYQAGLQFRFFEWLLVGAQYNLNQFQKISGTTFTGSNNIEAYYQKVDSQDYALSVSASF